MKFTRTGVACTGKTVWILETSPGDAHFSRQQFLEECAPPGNIATVHTIFPIHAHHTCPCFSLRLCPLAHKNCTRPTLRCSSHVDNSNMCTIFVASFMLLSLQLHMKKKIVSVVKTLNYISVKFQQPSQNTNT